MTTLATQERAALADLLDQVGPTHPTLCDGWRTQELLTHLVAREGDPLAAAGMFIAPLGGLTHRRMQRLLAHGSWTSLVDRFRRGRRRITVAAVPGVDKAMNGMEFFIHHEDVRRAAQGWEPRTLSVAHEEELWRRAIMVARLALRKSPVGVVLESALDPDDPVRVRSGRQTVTIAAKPSEMVLWLTGRREVAGLELVGTPEALEKLAGVTTRL